MKKRLIGMLLLGAGVGIAGCASDSPGGSKPNNSMAGTTSMPDPGDPDPSNCRTGASLAPARISLLSSEEYTNIIRDVFGVAFEPEAPPVETGDYPIDEYAQVGSVDIVKQYLRAADQVAEKLKPCGDAAVAAACVETFLRQKLPRAWRRPVTEAEITGLMAIFTAGLPDGEPRAVTLLMEAALGSGAFLYRSEVGTDASGIGGSVAMTPYELAHALSFSLLKTVPDDQLWAKAADGTITQPAVLSAEVDRLLLLPAARDNLTKKVSYYLNVERVPVVSKDATTFPDFTPTLKASLYQSAKMFLNDLVWNGSLGDIFTSNKYYANDEIARVYGLPAVQGSGLVEVQMPPERNAGILTHPGLLATTNHHTGTDDIVHRGLWIYDNLACGIALGAPPPGALEAAAAMMGTEREKGQQRNSMGQCAGCHRFFDSYGFASMNFDSIGRYRTIDEADGMPVYSQGIVTGLGDELDGPVSTMKEVADKLKVGRRVADCAAEHLAEYALDHNPNAENSCAIQQIKDNFASTGKFVDLFKAILVSPAFATRDLPNQ